MDQAPANDEAELEMLEGLAAHLRDLGGSISPTLPGSDLIGETSRRPLTN
jgi:hypothetical protein